MIKLTHYHRRPTKDSFSMERLYEDIRSSLPNDIKPSVHSNRFFSKGILRRLYDTFVAQFAQGDVNHVVGDVHFVTYFLDPRRTVLTIHDCVTLERLSGLKRWVLWLFWYWLPEKRCHKIIVVSEATRKQVLRWLKCDPKKISVIHNNVSAEFEFSPGNFCTTNPRILQIGTKENKNLERLAEALSGIPCELSIVGTLSANQINVLNQHSINYTATSRLSRDELLEQYQQCDLVAFVSTYEGFGLPIVEANATGRPVVTSNIWSMPEVAADAACLVDPFDVDEIRSGVLRIIQEAPYRKKLIENGLENAQRFQLTNIARQYAELYREIAMKTTLSTDADPI